MTRHPEWEDFYDELADVYEGWLEGDPIAKLCKEFYVELLRDTAGPVLELGVGTGRIARALAAAGVPVVGLDGSSAMLQRARALAGDRAIAPVRAYFEALPFPCVFRAVISPQRSMGHLADTEDLLGVLGGVLSVLLPGGRFVFDLDVFKPDWAGRMAGRSHLMHEAKATTGEHAVRVWNDYEVDGDDARRFRRTVRVERLAEDEPESSTTTTAAWSRWFDHDEIEAAATAVGFEVETCLGSFSGHPYGPRSSRMIWKLRRPLAA